MQITADFTQLHSGENLSRRLKFTVSEDFYGKRAKLGFITPLGNIYFTRELSYENGQGEFILPSALLDGRGQLLCQLFMWDETGYLGKSAIEEFPVYPSVDDSSCPVISEENKKSLALIFEYLEAKAEAVHSHDERYFTKEEALKLSQSNFDKNHTHNDLYYTQGEIDSLLAEKSGSQHSHDERYYTKESIDSMLEGVSPQGHSHDDRYYTEKEVNNLLSGKSDTEHNHDTAYAPLSSLNQVQAMQTLHSGLIGNLNSSMSLITDSVIDSGASGGWTYRKWSSGLAECWVQLGFWNEKVSNNKIKRINYNSALPFAFAETPTVFATASAMPQEAYYSVVSAVADTTHLQSVALSGFTSVETSILEGFISVYVTGRWQ